MTPQEEMKNKANGLLDDFKKKIQEAVDIATTYYNECGNVNGMSYKYELEKISGHSGGEPNGLLKKAQDNFYAMWTSLQDASDALEKINKRVIRHIDDTPDEDEFNRMKLHKFDDTPKEEGTKEYQSADDIIEDKEPKLRRLTLN